uniref:hypothetical protein n=1 Tax=Cardiobacterium valvarum TaxID=194702 RepID=UPI00344E46DC
MQQAKEQARSYLRAGQPFIFNATNISRDIRDKWTGLFADLPRPYSPALPRSTLHTTAATKPQPRTSCAGNGYQPPARQTGHPRQQRSARRAASR